MQALKDMAGQRRFLLVGDAKLISYPNVRDITGAKVAFIAPARHQTASRGQPPADIASDSPRITHE